MRVGDLMWVTICDHSAQDTPWPAARMDEVCVVIRSDCIGVLSAAGIKQVVME